VTKVVGRKVTGDL
jgi:hypothetical protein